MNKSQDFYLETVQQELQVYDETGLTDYLYLMGSGEGVLLSLPASK